MGNLTVISQLPHLCGSVTGADASADVYVFPRKVVLESLYLSIHAVMEPTVHETRDNGMLECFLTFSRIRGDIHAATAVVQSPATANEMLQQHARLTAASAVVLDLWILSMEGRTDAEIVGAMAHADTPRDLGAIWKWLLSINNAFPLMAVTISLLTLPVLEKSVEVMGCMGRAIEVVLGKKIKLEDMEAEAPVRYWTATNDDVHAAVTGLWPRVSLRMSRGLGLS